jgi:3-phosphoshikimate 1-carboxyvinyltransferase
MDVRWENESCITVASEAAILETELDAEIDVSSAFAVAALAAVSGRAEILSWPGRGSLQPDAVFPELLARMGACIEARDAEKVLVVEMPVEPLRGIDVDLRNSPDLFPVLATLCAFAEGRSVLHGAPHLAHKESSRIESTAQLLASLDRRCEIQSDGMIVHGRRFDPATEAREEISFDPKDDHRLAMAAAVAVAAGARVRVLDPETVAKSFPEFWSVAEGKDACASF